MIPKTC